MGLSTYTYRTFMGLSTYTYSKFRGYQPIHRKFRGLSTYTYRTFMVLSTYTYSKFRGYQPICRTFRGYFLEPIPATFSLTTLKNNWRKCRPNLGTFLGISREKYLRTNTWEFPVNYFQDFLRVP